MLAREAAVTCGVSTASARRGASPRPRECSYVIPTLSTFSFRFSKADNSLPRRTCAILPLLHPEHHVILPRRLEYLGLGPAHLHKTPPRPSRSACHWQGCRNMAHWQLDDSEVAYDPSSSAPLKCKCRESRIDMAVRLVPASVDTHHDTFRRRSPYLPKARAQRRVDAGEQMDTIGEEGKKDERAHDSFSSSSGLTRNVPNEERATRGGPSSASSEEQLYFISAPGPTRRLVSLSSMAYFWVCTGGWRFDGGEGERGGDSDAETGYLDGTPNLRVRQQRGFSKL
ncbi:hypothetical protein B0H11DRAFT_2248746 [Mycena galericulata]|nr:hypothetical protein B0H11DRAFT_2248746 [Mycena galericulata]